PAFRVAAVWVPIRPLRARQSQFADCCYSNPHSEPVHAALVRKYFPGPGHERERAVATRPSRRQIQGLICDPPAAMARAAQNVVHATRQLSTRLTPTDQRVPVWA